MKTEMRKVVLWQDRENRGTDKAYRFTTFPVRETHRIVWVPRSVVHHVSRDPMAATDTDQRCTVEIEEWFADKESL